jgi:glycosyltransferase involved in cell wall biosynthesis
VISVIICTYNRASYVRRTLSSFFAQSGLDRIDHELVVIDNNSTDDTRATVEAFQPRSNLRYVFEERQGIACARNRGLVETQADVVAYLDDDVIVNPGWLESLAACLADTNADVVGGRTYLAFEKPPPPWLGKDFRTLLAEMDFGPDRTIISDGRGIFSLNLGLRRSALPAAQPFDERLGRKGRKRLGGEETKLIRGMAAAGRRVVYEPTMIVGHIVEPERMTWRYFQRLAVATGQTDALNDEPAPLPERLRRVRKTCLRLVSDTIRMVRAAANDEGPYLRRAAMNRFVTSTTLLLERSARVFVPR